MGMCTASPPCCCELCYVVLRQKQSHHQHFYLSTTGPPWQHSWSKLLGNEVRSSSSGAYWNETVFTVWHLVLCKIEKIKKCDMHEQNVEKKQTRNINTTKSATFLIYSICSLGWTKFRLCYNTNTFVVCINRSWRHIICFIKHSSSYCLHCKL